MGLAMSNLLVLSYFQFPQSTKNGLWSQEFAGNVMQEKHLLRGQLKNRTNRHIMQAVKGKMLQQSF